MSFNIAKQFDFCYGHRVWVQELEESHALTTHCKCRHLHGHQGKILIHLSSEDLNEQGMVTDFNNLTWFKKWVDDYLDHKFIMDINDPLLRDEVPLINELQYSARLGLNDVLQNVGESIVKSDLKQIRPSLYTNHLDYVKEKYEGMVFVDFVPTSENLCRWLYGVVQTKMDEIGVNVDSIEFFETPKSSCVYTPSSESV